MSRYLHPPPSFRRRTLLPISSPLSHSSASAKPMCVCACVCVCVCVCVLKSSSSQFFRVQGFELRPRPLVLALASATIPPTWCSAAEVLSPLVCPPFVKLDPQLRTRTPCRIPVSHIPGGFCPICSLFFPPCTSDGVTIVWQRSQTSAAWMIHFCVQAARRKGPPILHSCSLSI